MHSRSMKIPNQNDIVDIFKISIKSVESIFSTVNSLLKVIESTGLYDSKNVDVVKKSSKNIVSILYIISDSISDINSAIFEINAVIKSNRMFNTMSDPQALIKFFKTGEVKELDYKNALFDNYLSLLQMSRQIADYVSGMKLRDIRKGKKAILRLLDSICEIYIKIYQNSLMNRLFSSDLAEKILTQADKASRRIIDMLTNNLKGLTLLIKSTVSKKDVRRAVGSLFSIYGAILWQSFLLGLRIKIYGVKNITKNLLAFYILTKIYAEIFKQLTPIISQVIKVGEAGGRFLIGAIMVSRMYKSLLSTFGGSLIKNSIRAVRIKFTSEVIIPLLANALKTLEPVIDIIVDLGNNFLNANFGLRALNTIFVSTKKRMSVVDIVSSTSIKKVPDLLVATFVAKQLNDICVELMSTVRLLTNAGKNWINIEKGIFVIKHIFLSQWYGRSLVSIFSSVDVVTFVMLSKALPTVMLLTLLMSSLTVTLNTLILAGRNHRRIRRGIKVVKKTLNSLSKILDIIISKLSAPKIIAAMASVVLISAVIVPLTAVIMLLGLATKFSIGAVITMLNLCIVMRLCIHLLKILAKNDQVVTKGSIAMLIIVGLISAVASTLMIVSNFSINPTNILSFIACFVASSLLIFGLAMLFSKVSMLGLLMLVVMVGTLFIAAKVIEQISQLEIDYKNIGSFALSLLMICGVVVVLSLVSLLLPIALIGTTMLTIELTMLMVVALDLMVIAKLKSQDFEKAKENIRAIMDVCTYTIQCFMQGVPGKPQKGESWMTKALKYMGGSVGFMAEAIMSMIFVATTFVTITFLMLIVAELALIQKLDIKKDVITGRIDDIFSILDHLVGKMFGKPRKPKSVFDLAGVFSPLITYIFKPLASLLQGIFAMGSLAISVISVTCLMLIAGELRIIQTINLQPDAINSKVDTILGTVNSIIQKLNGSTQLGNPDNKNWFRRVLGKIPILGNALDLIDAISSMGTVAMSMLSIGMVALIAENLKKIQDIDINSDTIVGKVDYVLDACKLVTKKVNEDDSAKLDNKKIESFGDYTKHLVKFIEGVNKLKPEAADSTVKLLDKANSVDVKKIKTVADMFSKMSEFSKSIKGDFEKLAKVLNEDLLDALNELNKYLDKASQKSSSVSVTPSPVTLQGMQPVAPATPTANTSTKSAEPSQDLGQIQQTLDSIRETIMTFTTSGIVIKDNED